jgi:hypothetical protein
MTGGVKESPLHDQKLPVTIPAVPHSKSRSAEAEETALLASTISNQEEEEAEALRIYVLAHELIPHNYVFDGSIATMARVRMAAQTLLEGRAGEEKLLGAIALLGHSPCPISRDTLSRCAHLPFPLGRVAWHALDECMSIGRTPPPGWFGADENALVD